MYVQKGRIAHETWKGTSFVVQFCEVIITCTKIVGVLMKGFACCFEMPPAWHRVGVLCCWYEHEVVEDSYKVRCGQQTCDDLFLFLLCLSLVFLSLDFFFFF
jgi:hypothetical protein